MTDQHAFVPVLQDEFVKAFPEVDAGDFNDHLNAVRNIVSTFLVCTEY